jgi:hypothetical protein
VHAHAHAHRPSAQRVGRGPGCVRSALGGRERDEERVSLRVHLHAAVRGELLAQEAAMNCEGIRLGIWAERMQEPRRPRDVREEKGDGAGR